MKPCGDPKSAGAKWLRRLLPMARPPRCVCRCLTLQPKECECVSATAGGTSAKCRMCWLVVHTAGWAFFYLFFSSRSTFGLTSLNGGALSGVGARWSRIILVNSMGRIWELNSLAEEPATGESTRAILACHLNPKNKSYSMLALSSTLKRSPMACWNLPQA